MPRQASLLPTKIPSRAAKGLAPWCVNVPDELSETGERQRLFFRTEKEAHLKYEEIRTRRHNFGASLGSVDSAQIAELAKCVQLLSDFPEVTVTDCVKSHLAVLRQRVKSITYLELFNRYLESKPRVTDFYRDDLKAFLARYPHLHSLVVCDITKEMLDPILSSLLSKPYMHNQTLNNFSMIFKYGIDRGNLATNPIRRGDLIPIERKEVEIIEPDDVAKIMITALTTRWQLLPILTLGFFCGIRAVGEMSKIEWRDIDLADGVIVIRPEVSKTRRRRFPQLSANATAWLEEYRAKGGSTKGKVMPWTTPLTDKFMRINRRLAGVTHWPHSAMRHSFCSYWLAKHENVDQLVLLSGHDSRDTMWRSYHKGTTKAAAEKFWSIVPPETIDNVVQFNQKPLSLSEPRKPRSPEALEKFNAWRRERYASNPAYREATLAANRERNAKKKAAVS